ncbi:hypothetical protein B0J12DRAFT_770910 [Macrophomina phaseolina]|uniref:Uncharacterized protein n=1 Tax=Macrophomina phaseolina TaxID=35725 RepID=A0ABQ8FV03_9PEZI|nr:hypothetical protein B0J12DRAFT_770910 [Macrophomina phaseolina]
MDRFFASGNRNDRTESPPASQGPLDTAQSNEEVVSSSESSSEEAASEDERVVRALSVEEVPPTYDYLYPDSLPGEGAENAQGDPQGDPQALDSAPVSSASTSHGVATKPAPADASASQLEASVAKEEGDSAAGPTAPVPRKRKRVSFAGEMAGDAYGESLIDDTSQHQLRVPPGRSEIGFDRRGHDQVLRQGRRKGRKRMARRFNTSLTPIHYNIGDVVTATVPPECREGKTAVLLSVIYRVIFEAADDVRYYILQTPFGVVDRPFAAHELELMDGSVRPKDLDSLAANTTISCKAACFRNAIALGVSDPRCNCQKGCTSNHCRCRSALAKCTRRCHKGKPCSNSAEPEVGESSAQGAGEGGSGGEGGEEGKRTRSGRVVKPTDRISGRDQAGERLAIW